MNKPFFSSLFAHQGIRFLVTGGVNTLFGYACYAAAVGFLRLPLPWALLVSMCAGIAFNFHSYGNFVFTSDHQKGGKAGIFIRFLLVYGTTYLLNLGLLKGFATYGISPYLAQLLALCVVVPITYVLLRYLVWCQSRAV